MDRRKLEALKTVLRAVARQSNLTPGDFHAVRVGRNATALSVAFTLTNEALGKLETADVIAALDDLA